MDAILRELRVQLGRSGCSEDAFTLEDTREVENFNFNILVVGHSFSPKTMLVSRTMWWNGRDERIQGLAYHLSKILENHVDTGEFAFFKVDAMVIILLCYWNTVNHDKNLK